VSIKVKELKIGGIPLELVHSEQILQLIPVPLNAVNVQSIYEIGKNKIGVAAIPRVCAKPVTCFPSAGTQCH
jgi:hypothetical protein